MSDQRQPNDGVESNPRPERDTIATKPDFCKYTGLANAHSRADHDSFHSATFNAHEIGQMLRTSAPISLEGMGAAAGRMSQSSTKLTAQHDVGKGGGSLDAPFNCAWLMSGPDRGCRRIRPGCIARHWLQSIWIPGAPCNSPPICVLSVKGVRRFEGSFGETPCDPVHSSSPAVHRRTASDSSRFIFATFCFLLEGSPGHQHGQVQRSHEAEGRVNECRALRAREALVTI